MRRRRALASLAGVLTGLAGCNGLGGGSAPTTPAPNPPGDVVEVPDTGRFVLRDPRIQEAIYDRETLSPTVRWRPGRQYLRFELAPQEEGYFPPPTVRLDGDPVPVERLRRPRTVTFAAQASVQSVTRVTVELNGVRWRLPSRVADRLARRPRFRLRAAQVVPDGDGAALQVTVANDGDRDGVWRGVARARWVDDGGEPVRQSVPAGETGTGLVLRLRRPPDEVAVLDDPEPTSRTLPYGSPSG